MDVVDTAPLEAEALLFLRQQRGNDGKRVRSVRTRPLAVVRINDAVFALSGDGEGTFEPLTGARPHRLLFWATTTTMVEACPACWMDVDGATVADLPVIRRAPLGDFVRRFGMRLEDAYEEWNRVLSSYGAGSA